MIYTIYHNPRCSKSREVLALLQSHAIQPTIIEYLKTLLNLEEIKTLRAHFDLKDFVRHNEPVFKALNLSFEYENELLQAIVKEPILMQRPIVTCGEIAVIGRPIESVLALITR